MSGLALAELLRAGLLFLLGLDIPPLITALVFQLPNSRRAPARPARRAAAAQRRRLAPRADAHARLVAQARGPSRRVRVLPINLSARAGGRRRRLTSSAWTWRRARATSPAPP